MTPEQTKKTEEIQATIAHLNFRLDKMLNKLDSMINDLKGRQHENDEG